MPSSPFDPVVTGPRVVFELRGEKANVQDRVILGRVYGNFRITHLPGFRGTETVDILD